MMVRSWNGLRGLALFAVATSIGCGDKGGSSDGEETGTGTSMTGPTGTDTSGPTNTTNTTPGTSDTSTSVTSGVDTTMGSESDGTTTETGVPPCPYTPMPGATTVAFQQLADGFDRPVLALGQPDQPDRLWVVEQGGDLKILEPDDTTAPADSVIHIDVPCANNNTIGCEQGLLGFAFHPDFPGDSRIYLAYTVPSTGATRVSEFAVAGDVADPGSERVVIEGAQPFGNHNGGMIAFGPDGYLYFGLGDGGNADDDPQMTGQTPSYILAKILRIGVEPDGTDDNPVACAAQYCDMLGPYDYTIPEDNPFVDDPSFAPEIWAWGFRNPWRFSFDLDNGDLWVGDVGQNQYEEIDLVARGENYGWSDMEANNCFNDGTCDESAAPNGANADGLIAPIIEYTHGQGCSVTGGSVYRSCESPDWSGIYFYGDYCSGDLYALTWDGANVNDMGTAINDFPSNTRILGNGWNAWGDVYITTVIAPFGLPIEDGLVYRIVPG